MFQEYDSQLKVHISLKHSFYGMFDAFKGAYWISSNIALKGDSEE